MKEGGVPLMSKKIVLKNICFKEEVVRETF
jgi:hypothetical protein